MVPFGGWEMPLSYPGGTIAEHLACRDGAVAFDVSHLGTVRLTGPAGPATGCRPRSPTTWARSARAGPSTPICSTTPTGRCSTTSSCGGSTTRPSTSCRTPPTPPGCAAPSAAPTSPSERAIVAIQGPDGPGAAGRGLPRGGRGRPVPGRPVLLGRRPVRGRRHRLHRRGRGGVRGARPTSPRRSGRRCSATGVHPAGLGRPGHPAPRGRPAAARPRAGPGYHPPAGRPRLGGGVVESRRASGVGPPSSARRPPASPACWPGWPPRGASRPAAAPPSWPTGRRIGEVTSGNFSPVLGHGIALAFLPPDLGAGRRGRAGLRGRRRARPGWYPSPFVEKKG